MSEQMVHSRFWMVWNPAGRPPSVKHFSRADADKEANRLAVLNPGQRFFVLKAVAGFVATDPPVKPIAFERHDEAPF